MNVAAGTYYGSSNAAQDDTTTSAMQSFTATLNHRFNDDWSVRNVTRVYDYALDRYNTLSSGTTDPVTMTVGDHAPSSCATKRACSTRPT